MLVEELAELLAVLHGAGLVHRDVKPDNVLYLTTSVTWRLMDLGITAHAGALCWRCVPVVTAAYARPRSFLHFSTVPIPCCVSSHASSEW